MYFILVGFCRLGLGLRVDFDIKPSFQKPLTSDESLLSKTPSITVNRLRTFSFSASQYAKLAISLRVPGGGGKKKKAAAAPQGGASGAPAPAEEEDDYEGGLC